MCMEKLLYASFTLLYGSFHQSFGFQHVWVLAMDHVANLSSMISIELRYRKPRNMSLHGDRLCQSVLHRNDSGYCMYVVRQLVILVFFFRDVNSKCTFAQRRYLFFIPKYIYDCLLTLPSNTPSFREQIETATKNTHSLLCSEIYFCMKSRVNRL